MMGNLELLPEKNFWLFDIVDFAESGLPEKGIVGKLKLEKLNVKVREELRRENLYTGSWELMINFRGPTDPGLSRLLDKYQKLELFELKKFKNKSVQYNLTEKGRKFKQGYEKYFSKVNPNFHNITNRVHTMLLKDIVKSGRELVETSEEIKEMKKEILREKIL
ncbi:hypothetical protein [Methanosarcina sp.]|uniref:hypothetical protein n=1 Tax=Methanosarcina sp. TaxID=2213 RepID=UPI002ABD0D99|nr:hypothetical protein [Methanosarcina sp.]MDY9925431.1 hypothetical protein [Methanosarcina sp.]